jgi:hypothetical protein
MDDIQELWTETPHHSWKALHDTLQHHKGKAEGISDNLVDLMLQISQSFEKSGKSFPSSPQQLYDELNQQIH